MPKAKANIMYGESKDRNYTLRILYPVKMPFKSKDKSVFEKWILGELSIGLYYLDIFKRFSGKRKIIPNGNLYMQIEWNYYK